MFGIKGTDKKPIIGLAVTPNLGFEACVYDKDTGEVVKYVQKFLEYNIASKEIQDMNAFRSAVSDAFDELGLSKDGANLYLVLPNVYSGFRSFEGTGVDDEAINSMILSETSESYIFKQEEPQSAWADMNAKTDAGSKYIAYTSIQKKVVEAVEDACMDIGATIIGIESSTSAIPRGVGISKLCEDVTSNNGNWDILLINPNGYSIFQMQGERLLDYIEVPFAVMSFDGEEVYSALSSAIGQYLPNYPAKKLVITSLSDNVSAQMLKNEIIFNEEIVAVESNKFATEPVANVGPELVKQAVASMSLSVLAAACPKYENFATLNVLGEANYDGLVSYGFFDFKDKTIEVTSEWISKVSIYSSIALAALIVVICGALFIVGSSFGARASSLQSEIDNLNQEVEVLTAKVSKSVVSLIKQISENNKTTINYYDSLSTDIPSHLWLTYYLNKNGKDVAIEGYSLNINDIYEYFKSLKVLSPTSNIKLNKLEVFTDELKNQENADDIVLSGNDKKQQLYSFEISSLSSYEKSFDEKGNKIQRENEDGSRPNRPNRPNRPVASDGNDPNVSYAARIPNVPDVEINLKEIK